MPLFVLMRKRIGSAYAHHLGRRTLHRWVMSQFASWRFRRDPLPRLPVVYRERVQRHAAAAATTANDTVDHVCVFVFVFVFIFLASGPINFRLGRQVPIPDTIFSSKRKSILRPLNEIDHALIRLSRTS